MDKKVIFYFDDETSQELISPTDNDLFKLYIGRKVAKYGDIFKEYLEVPTTLLLRDYYDEYLAEKEIVKVEFYEGNLLINSIEKKEDRIIKVYYEYGQIRSGVGIMQERISVWEYFINTNIGNKSL